MEIINEILEYIIAGGGAVVVANIITMFINEEKVSKYGKLVTAITKALNVVALNIFNNKNATDK